MRVLIFAHLDDKMGGRCTRHVHQQWARAMIPVMLVEVQPIDRHPIIAGIAAKDRTRLKTNHCVAAAPGWRLESVTGANERIGAVTGDTARAPYTATDGAGGPCRYTGWIVYRHSHQPPMIEAAIP